VSTTRRAAAIAAVLAVAISGPAFAATVRTTGPTGSPASIALFRTASRSTNALPAYVIAQSGYVRVRDSLGPVRTIHWAWGWAQFQHGYRPATERLTLVQRGGTVRWLEDLLTPAACPTTSRCPHMVPIELLVTTKAAFEGLVSSGSAASCFERVALAKAPYPAGGAWWAPFGRLSPPALLGALTEITSRFTSGPQPVTESDWLRTTAPRFTKSVVRVAAGGGRRAFSYHSTDTKLAKAPRFPALTICS
jgi:hypothetical protein